MRTIALSPALATAAALLCCLAWLVFRHVSSRQRMRRFGCQPIPRYPQRLPLAGTDFLAAYRGAVAGGTYVEFMQANFARHGRTFAADVWGQRWIFTCDPDNVRVLSTSALPATAVEPIRRTSGKGLMSRGMFVSDGEQWRLARALLKPLFSRAQVSDLAYLGRHVDRLFQLLPQDASTVDLQPMLKAMYSDISWDLLLGQPLGSQGVGEEKARAAAFDKAFETAIIGMFKKLSSGIRPYRTKEHRDWLTACKKVHQDLDEQIDSAFRRRDDRNDTKPAKMSMVDELVKETDDGEFVRDQLLNVFLGSKDTAGMGISQVFFHLARNPHVWTKLRKETLGFLDDGKELTFESLKSLTYLQCVLSESLRLHSPVDIALRSAADEIILPKGGGKNAEKTALISKGARIESCLTVLHRDRGIWGDDAEDFRPERWINGPLRYWDYVPFSGGPRICPAQQMVLTQFGYILTRFLQRFERLENRDPEHKFVTEIIFAKQSKNGVKVGLHLDDKLLPQQPSHRL